jgi:putative ABC transport system substrate-binding protein
MPRVNRHAERRVSMSVRPLPFRRDHKMRRRHALGVFISILAAAGARSGSGQSTGRLYKLGHLSQASASENLTRKFTLPELEMLGFVVGQNLVFDGRIGVNDDLHRLAGELLAKKPDTLITIGAQATQAARGATGSVPIVMFADDPVGLGYATSLARPGGNITGIANLVSDLEAKRLQLLTDAAPLVRRVGVLLQSSSPNRAATEPALRAGATKIGVELLFFLAESAADYPAVFASMREARVEALLIGADPGFFADAAKLAALARDAHLPTGCEWPSMARAGCVIGYGANQAVLRRRLAHYVARIFNGDAPSDLPIEQPTEIDLAINVGIAKSLGLIIPPALLVRADEVID